MSMFVRANSDSWNKADQSKYKDSIVFIEDSKQIYSNGVYYGAGSKNNIRLENELNLKMDSHPHFSL